ncbi:hypothetical protein BAC1_02317 [uncultured bacterium]|nr:hypothetical protein BAC1_02317 [uncultured bacterium]
MKKILFSSLVAIAALALAGGAQAVSIGDYPAGTAANGIGSSRHNMGSLGRVIRSTDTSEICVFCHTPHHTNTANNLKPLWNRGTQAPSAYTAYGATLGGSTVVSGDVGSTTLACLSCHDGVTTFDNLVNSPGKSGVVNGGSDRNWNFAMPASDVGGEVQGTNLHKFTMGVPCGFCHTGGLDQVNRLIIGTNLSNDHPVSIQYDAAKGGLRPTDTIINSIDLTSDLASSALTAYSANLAQNRWAVRGFVSDSATVGDLLRDGKVECSSCHDPHFRNLSWDETEATYTSQGSPALADQATWCGNVGENCADGQFLRRVGGNTGSGLCRTCHNK